MKRMKHFLWIIVLALTMTRLSAQSPATHVYANNSNSWIMYFGDHKVSDRWGVHLEAQLRRSDFLSNPQQLLLRTGINYHVNNQIFATLGYCFVETYPYGDLPAKSEFPEHRIWEQIQIKSQLERVEWVSRFRVEQRFVQAPALNTKTGSYEPGDAVYSNRFRLLNRVSVPFKGKTIVDKAFYVTAYDEILLNAGKNIAANFFDQNRIYAAIGYKIPKAGKLEIGYLYQTIQKPDGFKLERNSTLQLGLTSTLDFYKKKDK